NGRLGIFELMPVTETLRSMMIQKSSADELRAYTRSTGRETMYEQGLKLVSQGRTSLEEILRVTRA
ncbi:MAG: type II secretion system protein GspE, partial [Desulfonatronovibrio sp.]